MQECKYFIGEVISIRNWSTKNKSVLAAEPRSVEINKYLREVDDFIYNTIDAGRTLGKLPSGKELHKLLNERFKTGVEVDNEYTFKSFAEYWLKSLDLKSSTYATYSARINCVTAFYPDIEFDDITLKWRIEAEQQFREGKNVLVNGKQVFKQYSQNTMSGIFKRLKELLDLANDMGVTDVKTHHNKRWHVPEEEIDNIYLTEEEVDQIYNYEYSSDRLRNAADNLVLACDIGWRYSDYSRIEEKTMIYKGKDKYIRIKTSKSGDKPIWATIYVTERIDTILNRIRSISADKSRKYMKEVAEIAGIREFNKVGTHTGRRSFATNNYINGKSNAYIMACCGWKSEAMLFKYVKVVDLKIVMDDRSSIKQ